MNDMIKHNMFMFLVFNQDKYKRELLHLINQRAGLIQKEDNLLHGEIEKQFKDQVCKFITDDMTKSLAIPTDVAMEMLEDLNIQVYLGV